MSNKDDEVSFPKKWEKHLPTGWVDTAQSYSEDELKKSIVESQNTIADTEKDMDADEKLKTLKEDLKALMGGYKDLIKMHEAKVRYCVHLLRQRGNV